MKGKSVEEIRKEKLKELRLKWLEIQKRQTVSMLFEKNKDSIKIIFREDKKTGSILPKGFEIKVYGDFSDIQTIEDKVTEAILLGYRKMESAV